MAMESSFVTVILLFMVVLMSVGFVSSDDREECTNQLVGLAECLPYVGGTGKLPTAGCCTGLRQVLANSKKCLCLLIKDRDDPSLGLKINATLALNLPSICQSPTSVGDCPALLHLAPNSTEAQVFEQFDKSLHAMAPPKSGPSANATGSGSSAQVKSDAGRGKRWLGLNMICGFGILCWASILIIGV